MNTNSQSPRKKPVVVRRGNVKVKIYTGTNRVGDTIYPQHTLVYYSGSQRVKRNFASLEEAKREAEIVAVKLANGENEILKLTSTDRAIYIEAVELLRPLNVGLNTAVKEYVRAAQQLPQGATLREAVDFYIRRNPASLPQRTVRQVVEELIDQKTKGGRGDVYLKDLTGRLGKFADAFQMPIGQVTGPMMEKYISSLDIARRTKMNHLRLIVGLFKFAVRRKYLAKDALDELDSVEKPEAELTEIQIFSPHELREMLAASRPEIVPWLSIAAFAGLRHAELQRLDWSEINMAERHIEVPATKAKTASRRLVPMQDNLFAWLEPYRQESGRVTGFENMAKQIGWLIADMNESLKKQAVEAGHDPKNVRKFTWKRNALRHSFISYRLAVLKDVAAVALEAGNSPTMIFRNYRALVTENEGKTWFSIAPDASANIVTLTKTNAA